MPGVMAPRVRTVPRKRPRQERSRATVDAILDATAKVLVQDGYDRASTNRVALKAGVSVGSLYQYFPSKEALVAALIDRHMEEMTAALSSQLEDLGDKPPEEVVREVIGAMIAAHQVEPKLHAVLTEQIPRVGRLEKVVQINREVGTLVRAYLETVRERLLVKDLDAATFILVSTVEVVTHAMVIDGAPRHSTATIVEELTALVCRYLFGAAPKR